MGFLLFKLFLFFIVHTVRNMTKNTNTKRHKTQQKNSAKQPGKRSVFEVNLLSCWSNFFSALHLHLFFIYLFCVFFYTFLFYFFTTSSPRFFLWSRFSLSLFFILLFLFNQVIYNFIFIMLFNLLLFKYFIIYNNLLLFNILTSYYYFILIIIVKTLFSKEIDTRTKRKKIDLNIIYLS